MTKLNYMESTTHPQHTKVVKSYARQAWFYDWRFKNYLEETLRVALEALRLTGKEKILDVACGTGELERRIFDKFPQQPVWGVDISQHMLDLAHEKLGSKNNLILKQCDSQKIPFDDGQFDHVVTCSAFHYMREPQKVINEFARVLKPGGSVVLLDWCWDFFNAKVYHYFRKIFFPAHYRVYSLQEIRQMYEKAGLKVTQEKTFTVRVIWRMMCVTGEKKS